MPLNSVFISYSRKDLQFARKLDMFLSEAKVKVWLDKNKIEGGVHWDESLANAIIDSDVVLLILSNASVESENVKREYSWALDHGKTVVPIKLEECKVPFLLHPLHHIDFSSGFEKGQHELVRTLDLTKKQKLKLTRSKVFASKKKSKPWFKIALLIAIIALAYTFKHLWLPLLYADPWEFVVTVQKSDSEKLWLAPTSGKVEIIVNDSTYTKAIDALGSARFKLDSTFHFTKPKVTKISFEGPEQFEYRVFDYDSSYGITKETDTINLALELLNVVGFRGIVQDSIDNQPMDQVKISYSNYETNSGKDGKFHLIVPDKVKKDSIFLLTSKTGFYTRSNLFPWIEDSLVTIKLKTIDPSKTPLDFPRELDGGN